MHACSFTFSFSLCFLVFLFFFSLLVWPYFSEPPSVDPISFGESVINEGISVQANCFVRKGDKPLVIRWHLNGLQVFSSDFIRIDYVGGRSSILTLDPVRETHQGEYTCVVTNPVGEAYSSIKLKVNGSDLTRFFILEKIHSFFREFHHCDGSFIAIYISATLYPILYVYLQKFFISICP